MEYDITTLIPSLAAMNIANNHGASIIRLAKSAMQQKTEILSELMDIPAVAPDVGATIDISI